MIKPAPTVLKKFPMSMSTVASIMLLASPYSISANNPKKNKTIPKMKGANDLCIIPLPHL